MKDRFEPLVLVGIVSSVPSLSSLICECGDGENTSVV